MLVRFLIPVGLLLSFSTAAQPRPVILDADTANEVDDPFALARILTDTTVDVLCLNATQWEPAHYAVPNTMLASYRLNEVLLGYLEPRWRVPNLKGGHDRMYDWGEKAQHSQATYRILEAARQLPAGKKLPIITLGALTNVASALWIDPTIADRLAVYWLGSSYDFERQTMRKNNFNCVMDIQALEVVLDSPVELYVMPTNVAQAMQVDYTEVFGALPADHPGTGFLRRLWDDHRDGGRQARTLWDIALVEAFLRPGLVNWAAVPAPRANGGRTIFVARTIDRAGMYRDFFGHLGRVWR